MDTKTQSPHAAQPEPSNAFGTFSQFWKHETQHVLDESTHAAERMMAEAEKGVAEMNKLALVQMKVASEATRAFFAGIKVMTR